MTEPSSPAASVKTRHYTAESCHELGYGWRIEAPASMSPEAVEEVHRVLVEAADEPWRHDVQELLTEMFSLGELTTCTLDELEQVRVQIDIVHRDRWAQSFEPADKA